MASPLLQIQRRMRSFSIWLVAFFTSPAGIIVLAALDSTLFFSLPFGIDAAVIILAAQLRTFAWIVPLLATAGSVVGAWLTFWMGMKIGDKELERYVAPKRLQRIRAKIQTRGAVALAVLDLIPPPFPFTPFVLAAGALEVKTSTFFVTLTLCRLLRFGDLAAQHEPDTRAARFGGEERHEQVRRVGEAGSFIVDPELQAAAFALPADGDASAGLQRGIGGVVQKVDQQLFELIRVCAKRHVLTFEDAHRESRLNAGDAPDQSRDGNRLEPRRRQFGETRVRSREPAERIGSRGNHREPALHVLVPILRHLFP